MLTGYEELSIALCVLDDGVATAGAGAAHAERLKALHAVRTRDLDRVRWDHCRGREEAS